MSRYQFIEQVAVREPVQALCRVLAVSAARYYQWLNRTDQPAPNWEPAATAAFFRHAHRYGIRRLRAELRAEGHAVGRYALRTWLRRCGLRALSTGPQRPHTTVVDPAAVMAENLLLNQPAPTTPN
jgi:putative transposase